MWFKILGPVLALAVAFGAGWKVATWKASGALAECRGDLVIAGEDLQRCQAFGQDCAERMEEIRDALKEMTALRDKAQSSYEEAVAAPVRIRTVYRDRWHEAADVIVAEDCPDAVAQLHQYILTLPAYGGEVPE